MPSSTNSCVIPIFVPRSAGTRTPPGSRTTAKTEHGKEAGLGQCSARASPMTQPGEGLQRSRSRKTSYQLDLDVDTSRQVVEALKRVDRLRGRLMDVDQPLVGSDLEVLARGLLDRRSVVGLEPDPDLVLRESRHLLWGPRAR